MPLNLDSLAPPISLRPSVSLSDEELMRFSAENKGYKIERNNHLEQAERDGQEFQSQRRLQPA